MNKIIINIIYLFGAIILSMFSYIFVFDGIISKSATNKEVESTSVEWNTEKQNDTTWLKPTFYYEVNNEEYKCEVKYKSDDSIYYKKTKVFYNDSNPEICVPEYITKPKPYIIFFAVFPFLGIIYSIFNLFKSSL